MLYFEGKILKKKTFLREVVVAIFVIAKARHIFGVVANGQSFVVFQTCWAPQPVCHAIDTFYESRATERIFIKSIWTVLAVN